MVFWWVYFSKFSPKWRKFGTLIGQLFKIFRNLRQMAQISAKNFDFWYMDGSLFLQNGYMDGWHFKNPSGTPLPRPKLSTPPPGSWLVMLVVGLIDIEHMQSVIKGLFFFSKNYYYFSDLETQWPQNPELKSRFCLSSTVIRGGKSQYWRKKVSALFLPVFNSYQRG